MRLKGEKYWKATLYYKGGNPTRRDYMYGGGIWRGLVQYAYLRGHSPLKNYGDHSVYNRELDMLHDYFNYSPRHMGK